MTSTTLQNCGAPGRVLLPLPGALPSLSVVAFVALMLCMTGVNYWEPCRVRTYETGGTGGEAGAGIAGSPATGGTPGGAGHPATGGLGPAGSGS